MEFEKMENITEKKWFVYVKDHHEGPHSVAEIHEKIAEGVVESEGFVWAEGMDDWTRMTDVPTFLPQFKTKAIFSASIHTDLKDEAEPLPLSDSKTKGAPFIKNVLKGAFFGLILLGGVAVYQFGMLDAVFQPSGVPAPLKSVQLWTRSLLGLLGGWVSPLPSLPDVSAEEYEELNQAAKASLDKSGPKFAIAISRSDPLSPSFYVATNVGEGAKFRFLVEGVSETLLNQLSVTLEFEAVASKKIGKTTEVRFADGRAIPRGEYLIYLTAVDQQSTEIQSRLDAAPSLTAQLSNEFPKNTRILAFKRYFLAGSKDLSYQERLKDFHEKLRARALSELNESKQFIATLSSQLTLTQDQFAAIKSHKQSVHKADLWEKFHTSWIKLQGELDQIFAKWTPDAIKNEYFYGFIYKEIQDAAQALGRVHSRQTDYFKGGVPPQNSDAELSGELKRIDDNLRGLQSKLEQAEKLPPTPGGMPQREGL